jgi:hypothetical protein
VSDRDGSKAAERRAERIKWRGHSRLTSQASRNMDQRLRRMNERASELDGRLRRHAAEGVIWHREWDDPAQLG